MIAVITVIVVGCAAAFILSRSRRQQRPIGAFRSSADSATFLALGDSVGGDDDRDNDGQESDPGDAGDAGDSGGGDSGGSGGDGGGE